MASTISAGTTTTTALVYTADTSGVLQLQTNGTTTAVTIDTSQNVGVNTTNPSAYGKLVVSGGGFTQLATLALPSTSGSTRSDFTRVLDVAGSRSLDSGVSSSGSWVQSRDKNDYSVNYNLLLQPNGGNVGISTSSPSHLLTVNQGSSSTTGLLISGNSSPGLNITETSSSNNLFLGADSSAIYVSAQTSTPLVFRTNSTEYMRLDTSGNLLVGTTSIGTLTGNSFFAAPVSGGANIGITHSSGTSSGQNYAGFLYNGTTIGSITQSGTTSVNFNGNSVPPSDQRLKENIVDAPSAQTFLNNIKVRSFDWIADKTHQTYGMIAQELMTVAPEVVPTPPDENTMMGIDYAKLVPALIKCVQELSAKVTALEAKVGA